MHRLQAAHAALRQGKPVLLYDADGREEETDLVVAANHATPDVVHQLRTDGGGLLCLALAPEHHQALDLPFLVDVVQEGAARHPVLTGLLPDDIRYDGKKPAFGLTINARATFTGITDAERSLTIRSMARLVADLPHLGRPAAQRRLAKEFRSPGHVSLLNGAEGGLATRQGHTELSLELARQAGTDSCVALCEMLEGTAARSRASAQAYAERHGLVFLTGEDVMRAWQRQAQRRVPTFA